MKEGCFMDLVDMGVKGQVKILWPFLRPGSEFRFLVKDSGFSIHMLSGASAVHIHINAAET